MLDGIAGSTDREERGIKGVRGEVAVAVLRAEGRMVQELKAQYARQAKSSLPCG